MQLRPQNLECFEYLEMSSDAIYQTGLETYKCSECLEQGSPARKMKYPPWYFHFYPNSMFDFNLSNLKSKYLIEYFVRALGALVPREAHLVR